MEMFEKLTTLFIIIFATTRGLPWLERSRVGGSSIILLYVTCMQIKWRVLLAREEEEASTLRHAVTQKATNENI